MSRALDWTPTHWQGSEVWMTKHIHADNATEQFRFFLRSETDPVFWLLVSMLYRYGLVFSV